MRSQQGAGATRRRFLAALGATVGASAGASAGVSFPLLAGGRRLLGSPPSPPSVPAGTSAGLPVTDPRATDGDARHEPAWEERLTLTVGVDQGDLQGRDDKVLQAAVDYVHRLGGGTVRILPGTFTLRNAVFLPSGVRLQGSGAGATVLTKIPSETIPLAADSDWYDQEITLSKPGNFRVGDGVVLRATNPHNGVQETIKRTLVAVAGRRWKLDQGLRKNLWLNGKPTAASLFPLLTSERTTDVVIEQLTLDGNAANNERLDGNYAGCIFLQDCNRYTIRGVEARNYNGDGISFQICHDVLVEDCHSHHNADLGLHPGSGSQRPVLRRNRLEENTIGLFWCWGVKYGLAEDNQMVANRNYGISIGHNDTHNVMRRNQVLRSGRVGILFRDDSRGQDFWANHNVVEHNVVEDSGPEDGVAIDVMGRTHHVRITQNQIRDRRGPARRTGIRLSEESREIHLADNHFEGLAQSVSGARPS